MRHDAKFRRNDNNEPSKLSRITKWNETQLRN